MSVPVVKITLRLPDDLHDYMVKRARVMHRSLNAEILSSIEDTMKSDVATGHAPKVGKHASKS